MIRYYKNRISCGANRREFEDQSAIKGNLDSNEIGPSWSHILGIFGKGKNVEKKKKKKKKKRRRRRRKKAKKGMDISMDLYGN